MGRSDPLLGVRVSRERKEQLTELAGVANKSLQELVTAALEEEFFWAEAFDFDPDMVNHLQILAHDAMLAGRSPIDAIMAGLPADFQGDLAVLIKIILRDMRYDLILAELARQGARQRIENQELPGPLA